MKKRALCPLSGVHLTIKPKSLINRRGICIRPKSMLSLLSMLLGCEGVMMGLIACNTNDANSPKGKKQCTVMLGVQRGH